MTFQIVSHKTIVNETMIRTNSGDNHLVILLYCLCISNEFKWPRDLLQSIHIHIQSGHNRLHGKKVTKPEKISSVNSRKLHEKNVTKLEKTL